MSERVRTAEEIFDLYAKEYCTRFGEELHSKDAIDRFVHLLGNETYDVLELGCGPGNICSYLLKNKTGINLLATDISAGILREAERRLPEIQFMRMDARDISQLNRTFHAVICSFCIPYISHAETVKLIRDIGRSVKPNGIFYISFIERDPEFSGVTTNSKGDQCMMYYYSEEQITELLLSEGFNIRFLTKNEATGYRNNEAKDTFIVCSKVS